VTTFFDQAARAGEEVPAEPLQERSV